VTEDREEERPLIKRGRRFWRILSLGLIGAAVATELRKPEGEREWHGYVGGVVPYEFRPPTLERIKLALWNPADPRVFVPTVFGVGWTINFARLFAYVS
jgi:hypothetical protein